MNRVTLLQSANEESNLDLEVISFPSRTTRPLAGHHHVFVVSLYLSTLSRHSHLCISRIVFVSAVGIEPTSSRSAPFLEDHVLP